MRSRIFLATMISLAAALTGCSGGDAGTDATRDTIEDRTGDAQEATRDGLAGFRTDVERLNITNESVWNAIKATGRADPLTPVASWHPGS